MNVAEARKLLSGTLVFGDDAQVRAVRFLQGVEEAQAAILRCEEAAAHVFDIAHLALPVSDDAGMEDFENLLGDIANCCCGEMKFESIHEAMLEIAKDAKGT